MADSHSSGDYSDVVSRRKFVSLAGTTGAAAVAGCLGDDDGGDDGDGDDTGQETGSDTTDDSDTDDDGPTDEYDYGHEDIWFETATSSFEPNSFQYNPEEGWFIPHSQFGLFAPWAQFLMGPNEFVPHLIQDWEHTDDNTFVMTLSEDFTWGSSGDSITAEDLKLQLDIQNNGGDALFDLIDSAEATGEYELTLSYGDDTRQDFVTTAALDRNATFAPSIWEGEADNEDPGSVEVPEPDPSGPIALTDTDANYHQYEPRNRADGWEDDPVAGDHINWNGYRLGYRQDNNAFHQSFIANELDGCHSLFASPETLDQFPDSVRQLQIPGLFGVGIWPDHTDEDMGNRNVRQALYYSLDRDAVIENVGASTKIAHPTPVGLTASAIEPNLGDVDSDDDFNSYDLDVDQAESLLEDAGYDGPGDVSGTLVYPSGWSDWAVTCQSAIDQLDSAGWDIEGEGRSGAPGDYAPNMTNEDFNLCAHTHTAGGLRADMTLPWFSLDFKLRHDEYDLDGHFAGYDKDEVEIDGETINIDDEFDALATAAEGDREQHLRALARVFNIDVPCLVMVEKYEQSFINEDRFDIPDDTEHFNGVWPMWWLPQVDESLESASDEATPGLLKARTN